MKGAGSFLRVFVVLFLATVSGCVPFQSGSSNVIGTLRVSGPNVWLNNAQGRDGQTVLAGASVTTGPGSSALVEFRGGGYLQIDQNTDPLFEWLEQSRCILIRLIRGQAYLKRERACVEGPNISLVLNSEANIRITGSGLSEITLVRGSAEVTAPERIRLVPGEQLTAGPRGVASLRVLSPRALAMVGDWRRSYRFPRLPAAERVPPEVIPFPGRRPRQPSPPAGATGPETPPPPPSGSTAPPARPGVRREIPTPSMIRPDVRRELRSPSVIEKPEPVIR